MNTCPESKCSVSKCGNSRVQIRAHICTREFPHFDTEHFDSGHVFIQELNYSAQLARQFVGNKEEAQLSAAQVRLDLSPVIFYFNKGLFAVVRTDQIADFLVQTFQAPASNRGQRADAVRGPVHGCICCVIQHLSDNLSTEPCVRAALYLHYGATRSL